MTVIPQHWMQLYQRPKQGSNFLRRYHAYNYQHSISNQGWFDTASCDVGVQSESEGRSFLELYLGAFVAFYVNNPLQPIWEGLINRITFNSGGASYTISLDELANRVTVVHTNATNVAGETPAVNNTRSQAIYGIKQDQIEFGSDPGVTAQRTNLRDTILAQRAFPQTSYSQAQGNSNLVHLELIGIFHTLEWEKLFTATSAATTAFNTTITSLLSGLANGSTFFNNADTSQVTTNATVTSNQQRGLSVWERIQKIAESGDASNYWIAGITPTDKNKGTRVLYYRAFNSTVEYTARQADGLKVRSIYGRVIPPWLVVPDRAIRVVDTLIGSDSTLQTDLRATYIQSIQYDANSQSVQWFGADDTTARAAFLLKRGFKPFSRAFGAPTRILST